MDIAVALITIEQTALDALPSCDLNIARSADQLFHIARNVAATFTRGVHFVEAILAEEISALFAFHHRGIVLTFLAHDDGLGLLDNVNLHLCSSNITQLIYGRPQILHERFEVEFLFDVRLERRFDDTEQVKLTSVVDVQQVAQLFDDIRRCDGQLQILTILDLLDDSVKF